MSYSFFKIDLCFLNILKITFWCSFGNVNYDELQATEWFLSSCKLIAFCSISLLGDIFRRLNSLPQLFCKLIHFHPFIEELDVVVFVGFISLISNDAMRLSAKSSLEIDGQFVKVARITC